MGNVGAVTTIAAVHGVLGAHRYPQAELTDVFAALCLPAAEDGRRSLARRLHTSAKVANRHLALPLEEYARIDGFTAANDAFLSVAVDLGAQAVAGAVKEAGLDISDVDLIVSTTVTGIAVPSLDARIAGRLGLRPDVKRVPLMGLGCVASAAGIARVHDHLLGAPDAVAVLVAVELCSLTVQRGDPTTANMVAAGLFGDGAAAVVLLGADRGRAVTGPRVVASRSHLYPNTERAMGWDVGSSGLRIVLGTEVPELVSTYLGGDVAGLLADHGLTIADIGTWVCHPGGPKVIEAIQDSLGLPPAALELTWRSLREVGNLSSASVLHVLRDTLALRPPNADDWAVLMAMGPGFCAELVLLRW
ncbi:MAG TPA: 3-oxoacyl-[acyl-carrier-protein] synthase III C-terminal domain-containing protein [Pseudonocardiaceae bacterium]|jgi:alkylresorcinol/alkylpyrone synthase|nr:3-oxoacyl-[acyl-carrier-protein] synthase III C-terminal domain-containing protein [Pseudonocardiaceae bacterium]